MILWIRRRRRWRGQFSASRFDFLTSSRCVWMANRDREDYLGYCTFSFWSSSVSSSPHTPSWMDAQFSYLCTHLAKIHFIISRSPFCFVCLFVNRISFLASSSSSPPHDVVPTYCTLYHWTPCNYVLRCSYLVVGSLLLAPAFPR